MQLEHRNPLPDFYRCQWVSSEARKLWAPRVHKIGPELLALERVSVEAGIRPAAMQMIPPEQLPELTRKAAAVGLVVAPLEAQGRVEGYAAESLGLREGKPWDYRVVITSRSLASQFVKAYHAKDDDAIGAFLGYPECCRKFFLDTWGAESVDPTWEMEDHGDGPIEANILLRWMGVRWVFHLPCSFTCEKTLALGKMFRQLISQKPEASWIDELLAMPMKWTSLFGIGEVVTPLVSLNFRSDVSYALRLIERQGKKHPEAGACGLGFPYRISSERREFPIIDPVVDEQRWKDNDFGSSDAMEQAHRTVIMACGDRWPDRVLDLGCGNGLLARKLAGREGYAAGVELDPAKAERAKKHLTAVYPQDMFEVTSLPTGFDVVVLMPGRLLEVSQEKRRALLEVLPYLGKRLLVYAYGDWLERQGSFDGLCLDAGLEGRLTNAKFGDDVTAGIWEWEK